MNIAVVKMRILPFSLIDRLLALYVWCTIQTIPKPAAGIFQCLEKTSVTFPSIGNLVWQPLCERLSNQRLDPASPQTAQDAGAAAPPRMVLSALSAVNETLRPCSVNLSVFSQFDSFQGFVNEQVGGCRAPKLDGCRNPHGFCLPYPFSRFRGREFVNLRSGEWPQLLNG